MQIIHNLFLYKINIIIKQHHAFKSIYIFTFNTYIQK